MSIRSMHSRRTVPTQRTTIALALGARGGVRRAWMPAAANTASNATAGNTDLEPSDVDRLWQSYLRRFDVEHTFRMFKQTLGWTKPRLRDPQAADRWTWLIIVAYTQLRLGRDLTADLRRPWERPAAKPGWLTPARVRRGFRHLRAKLPVPADAPKPSRPGPGRP